MAIRAKTKKRVLIMLIFVIGLGAAGGGAYWFRQRQFDNRALEARERGMEALERGELEDAINHLAKYLKRFPADVQCLYDLACARRQVALPDRRHVTIAIGLFRQVIDLEPDRAEAQRALMELYQQSGFSTETLTTAKALLGLVPSDPEALRATVKAQFRLRRMEDALGAALELNEFVPDDLDGHVLTLLVMRNLQQRSELVERAESLIAANPGNVRFELLLAVAQAMIGKREEAERLLTEVSKKPAPDAAFVRILVETLDRLGKFEDSLATLRRQTRGRDEPEIRRLLIRRLWEVGFVEEVESELSKLDPKDPESDCELLAFLAWARIERGRAEEADAILDALAAREFDLQAKAWVTFLRGISADEAPSALELSVVCQTAGSLDIENPYVHYALGEAYYRLGEYELALRVWKHSAELSPTWAIPLVRIAEVSLALGDANLGRATIGQAYRRARSDLRVLVPWALAGGLTEQEELDDLIGTLSGMPEARAELVVLLFRAGRGEEAEKVVRSALAKEPAPDERALIRLAAVCRAAGSELSTACLDRAEKAHGLTADQAFLRATWLAAGNGDQGGLDYLEAARERSSGDEDADAVWDLAFVRFLDRLGDARALGVWRDLADRRPEDLLVQRRLLGSRIAWSDRALVDRAIERLRALTGERGLRWQVARAKWHLSDPEGGEDALTKASTLLGEVVSVAPEYLEARVHLARTLERLQNVEDAVVQLQEAVKRDPSSVLLSLELARLLQKSRDFGEVRNLLGNLAAQKSASPDRLRSAAILLARQGDLRMAIPLLEAARERAGGSGSAEDVLLVRWYTRLGDLEKAEKLSADLAGRDDPQAITAAALHFESRGDRRRAEKTIARLSEIELLPADRELALADYHRVAGDLDLALADYRRATELSPDSAVAWQGRLVTSIMLARADEARAAAEGGRRALPDDETFAFLSEQRKLFEFAVQEPRLIAPLVGAIENASDRNAFLEAALIVSESQGRSEEPEETLARLLRLARRHPEALPLQIMVIQELLGADDTETAITLALKAMREFPYSGTAAHLAAMALSQAERWDDAHSAAVEWRRRTLADAVAADVLVARIRLRLGRYEDAFRRLEPYLPHIKSAVEGRDGVLRACIGVLVASRRMELAAELLEPLAKGSASWRLRWILLASRLPDSETAVAWLERVADLIPEDGVGERLNLVRGWCETWRRFGQDSCLRTARRIVDELAKRGEVPASVYMAKAMIADEVGEDDAAIALYEDALALEPKLAVVHNNLAVIHSDRGADKVALRHARRALELSPREVEFHDTLAMVHTKAGRLDKAREARERTVELAPKEPVWRLRLVRTLIDAGDKEKALEVLNGIEEIRPRGGKFLPEIEKGL
ncbi:MAG: tetratricopeptide repeat protein, partial [Planctomycetota bacterium]